MKSLENKFEKLAYRNTFVKRVFINVMLAIIILVICLGLGTWGYHYFAQVTWIDAFHNASMILSGMGPVIDIKTKSGKLFSSFYALFSGVVFITNIGILFFPIIHRIIHKFHLDKNR